MLFRQLFDSTSSTYTYLLAPRRGGEALIIDPVLERVDLYLKLLGELDLHLVKAIDTHVHADHVTALGALRDRTRCVTVMSERSGADVVSMRVADGDLVEIEGLALTTLYTPGHTDDSCCFVMADRVFTGDTLLIRGTGRTDFQNGDPADQYRSIFGKLLALPDETLVFPAHDYNGNTVTTIGEERAHNPRLQVGSLDEYVALMNGLNLPSPKMMDVAVPANRKIGLDQETLRGQGLAVDAAELSALRARDLLTLVDVRDGVERRRDGTIEGSVHVPYAQLGEQLGPNGMLRALVAWSGKPPLFYCAFGERSAMAVRAAIEAGIAGARHLDGGIEAWKKAEGPLLR